MGKALTNYPGFKQCGLSIAGLIDSDEKKVGDVINGLTICTPADIKKEMRRTRARIGIITTPASSAQDAADMLVGAGVEAIWNFAPIRLSLPDTIVIENVNFSVSLSVLNSRLLLKVK